MSEHLEMEDERDMTRDVRRRMKMKKANPKTAIIGRENVLPFPGQMTDKREEMPRDP